MPRSRSQRRFLALIASAVLIPAAILGVTEIALRVAGVGTSYSALRPCTDQGRPAFCDNQFFTSPFFPPGMQRTPRPYAIPAKKDPNTYRIFILGESASWGDPDPTYGFARYLEVMLRQQFPDTNFEVINTSITAINSHVLLPLTKDLANHQPDLLLIYTGNNEVVGPYGPGTVLTPGRLSLSGIRARIFLNSTHIGQLASKLAQSRRRKESQWHGMEMFLEQQVRADSPQMAAVYGNFATNLSDIVEVAQRSGAKVLLSTVATNLKDCAPFASLHREGLKPDELSSWDALVKRGSELQASGSTSEALQAYLSATEIDPQYAELQFRIARCLWELGDFPAARERFIKAQDLDTLRFRADSRINQVIRNVAGGRPGVELLDASQVFAADADHGIPGRELFYEHVHMNPHGNYVLARALTEKVAGMMKAAMQAKMPSPHAGQTAWTSEEDCNRLLALTNYDRARLAGLVLSKLKHPPFTQQLNYSEEVSSLTTEANELTADYEATLLQYQWAIAQNPRDRLLHLNYGFFLYRYAPEASTREMQLALPYDNAPVLCNWRKFD